MTRLLDISMQGMVLYIVACQGSGVSSETAIHRTDKTTLPFSPLNKATPHSHDIPINHAHGWVATIHCHGPP